jgi:Fe-S-cluster containining protein
MQVVPFKRTNCACHDCTKCCKRQPGALAPDDFERIRDFLGETDEQARKHFWASPGALVRTEHGTKRVGTVTPQMRKGRCVFLDDKNRCTIHAVAPFGCSMFDTHMSAMAAHARSLFLVRWQASSRAYSDLRRCLPYARTYKPNAY